MCGETLARYYRGTAAVGLSPRVRGNRRLDAVHRHGRGSIPACTGKPRTSWSASGSVYPRVGGTVSPVFIAWDLMVYRVYGETANELYPRVYGGTDCHGVNASQN